MLAFMQRDREHAVEFRRWISPYPPLYISSPLLAFALYQGDRQDAPRPTLVDDYALRRHAQILLSSHPGNIQDSRHVNR